MKLKESLVGSRSNEKLYAESYLERIFFMGRGRPMKDEKIGMEKRMNGLKGRHHLSTNILSLILFFS